jgi:hypothetical protein
MSRVGRDLYFLRSTASGAVKIGSAGNVGRRRRELELAAGQPLELLIVVPGGGQSERRLHVAFDDDRRVGEWFQPGERLTHLIDSARNDEFPGRIIDRFLGWSDPRRPRAGVELHEFIVHARAARGNAARRLSRQTKTAARVAELRSDWWRRFVQED